MRVVEARPRSDSRRDASGRAIVWSAAVSGLLAFGLNVPALWSLGTDLIRALLIAIVSGVVTAIAVGLACRSLQEARSEIEIGRRILREMENRDRLTGLFDRRTLLADYLALGEANAVLCLIDVDRFRTINSAFGHDAGDRALTRLAKILTDDLAGLGKVYRTSGEEFAFLSADASQAEVHMRIGTLINRVRSLQFGSEGAHIQLTVSAGIAYVTPGMSFTAAYDFADQALSQAKVLGRNRVAVAEGTRAPSGFVEVGDIAWGPTHQAAG